jgi:2-keto-4-pentenoate hydratase/2-oxohepta-3-ene-1,7-dioic acid hydratase in catechol pathway
MKIGFFDDWVLGVVKNDTHIVDVSEVLEGVHAHGPQELITLIITNWDQVKDAFQNLADVSEGKPLSEVKMRPPIPRPDKIVCMAVNYLEYGQRPMPHIDAFLKDSDSVIGDGDTIILDAEAPASIFHHEAEMAVIIGKDAEDKVDAKDAMDYVFGYTGFIDVSGRNIGPEGKTSFFQVKSWRTFGPMGPFIITKDEIDDPQNIDLAITVNDSGRQAFNTSDMAHPVTECIEFATRQFPLHAGDIISTGTNHQGLGALQNGDTLKFEVGKVGSMTLHVKDSLNREWERGIDEEMAARARNSTV